MIVRTRITGTARKDVGTGVEQVDYVLEIPLSYVTRARGKKTRYMQRIDELVKTCIEQKLMVLGRLPKAKEKKK